MQKLFLVPGLGADERLFKHLDLDGYKVVPVKWLVPDEEDTITSYAGKLISHYHINSDSVIIGVSLGGMLTVEIANAVAPKKAIIISSIKIAAEIPWYFKLYELIPLYRLLSERQYDLLTTISRPFFGRLSKEDWLIFKDMFNKTPAKLMRWAIGAILNWNNRHIPAILCHIIGDKDLIFLHKRIRDAHVISGGTHMMVFDKAEQINSLIQQCLKN